VVTTDADEAWVEMAWFWFMGKAFSRLDYIHRSIPPLQCDFDNIYEIFLCFTPRLRVGPA